MPCEGTWGEAPFTVTPDTGEPFIICPKGRVRWALECLLKAGAKGCTPITMPGPRWSDYVFKLRAMGVDIETVHEDHGGDFPGHHGRYVLRSRVTPGRAVPEAAR
ncbi:MAG: winged helix domain-containing protein [Hasllibacter sp.]